MIVNRLQKSKYCLWNVKLQVVIPTGQRRGGDLQVALTTSFTSSPHHQNRKNSNQTRQGDSRLNRK
jgi:hypothetical protein